MKEPKPNEKEEQAGAATADAAGRLPEMSGKVISIDEGVVREHLDRVVVQTVEQTLNALLQAEADALCGASRYEHASGALPAAVAPQGGRGHAEGAEAAQPAF